MPRDDWRKARDRSVARAAKREFAAEGRSSFPYVWGDDPARESGDRPAPERPGATDPTATRAVWCVYDNTGVAVATFDHRDRADADDAAVRLTRDTGALHYVALRKVPMAPVPPEPGATTTPATPNPTAGAVSRAGPGRQGSTNPRQPGPNPVPVAGPPSEPATEGSSPVVSGENNGESGPWYRRVWQLIRRAWRSS